MRKTTQLRTLFALGLIVPAAVMLALFVVRAYAHDPGGADKPEGAAAIASTEGPADVQPWHPDREEVTRGEDEGIPLQITHQGVIKVNGRRFKGDGYFRFALVDPDGNNVWTNDGTQLRGTLMPTDPVPVPVVDGVYRVALGDTSIAGMEVAIETPVFTENPSLQLRIWFDDGFHGPYPLTPDLKVTSTGYAYQAYAARDAATLNGRTAAQLVPIGTVLDWWRPNATFPLPDGFQICNGSTVNDPDSPLNGQVLPNLTDRFVRGVTNPAYIGQAGGSSTHTHTINHDHDSQGTSSECKHNHKWSTSTTVIGGNWYDGNEGPDGATRWCTTKYVDRGTGFDNSWLGICAGSAVILYTDDEPVHSHSVDLPSGGGTSGPASPDHIPPYVGLLKIMRIK